MNRRGKKLKTLDFYRGGEYRQLYFLDFVEFSDGFLLEQSNIKPTHLSGQ